MTRRPKIILAGAVTLIVGVVAMTPLIIDSRQNDSVHKVPQWAAEAPEVLALKQDVPCPAPSRDVLALFVIGQSNAGNHGRFATKPGDARPAVLEFWNGRCMVAASPMLGATGLQSSFLPQIGARLLEAGAAHTVIFGVFSVDGSAIGRYVGSGDLSGPLQASLRAFATRYHPNAILWMQGESDFAFKTSSRQYADAFRGLERGIRRSGIHSPILVSIQTRCTDPSRWQPDNEVAQAQRALARSGNGLFPGIDLDGLLDFPGARYDGCHLSYEGAGVAAAAWADRLVAMHNPRPRP